MTTLLILIIATSIIALPITCLDIFLEYKRTKQLEQVYIVYFAISFIPFLNLIIAFLSFIEIYPVIKNRVAEKKFEKDHPELISLNLFIDIYKVLNSNSFIEADLIKRIDFAISLLSSKHSIKTYSELLSLNELTFTRILSIVKENLKVDTEKISKDKIMSLTKESLILFLNEFEAIEEQKEELKKQKEELAKVEKETICNRHIEELKEEIGYQKTRRINIVKK